MTRERYTDENGMHIYTVTHEERTAQARRPIDGLWYAQARTKDGVPCEAVELRGDLDLYFNGTTGNEHVDILETHSLEDGWQRVLFLNRSEVIRNSITALAAMGAWGERAKKEQANDLR